MSYSNLLYEVTDSVAVVTVDRPAKLNALTRDIRQHGGLLHDAAPIRCGRGY
jgi:enoyl-CoA hydratase/carnithine racemase